MKYTFTIPGNPIPLARARINPKAFFGSAKHKMWDPQKELKLVTAITLQNQFDKAGFFTGPIHLDVIFYMPIPKCISKKKKESICGTHHIAKPDLDNLVKFICDSAHGILYHDDSLIASITTKKLYDLDPRTVFTLESII